MADPPPIRVYRSGSSAEIDPTTPGLESQQRGGTGVDTQGDRPPSEFEPPSGAGGDRGPITRADRMRALIAQWRARAEAARQRVAQLGQPGPDETPQGELPSDQTAARQARSNRVLALNQAQAELKAMEASIDKLETDLANDPDAKPPAAAKPPSNKTPVTVNGKHFIYDPADNSFTPAQGLPDEVPKQDEVFPEAKVPAARPGQRTDLNAVMTAFQQYSAQLYQQAKAGTITWPQAQAMRDQYYQQTVAPAAARANQEANDYAAAQQARQAEQDAREREQGQRARDLAERQARTAEASQRLGEERFFAEAGQDAVKNATDLLRYQANPAFAEDFARALNVVSSGGGPVSFRPEAFRINLPDTAAIAEQAAQRAAAHYAARAVPYAGAAAGGLPAAGTAPMSVQQSLDAVPLMAPRSMPGAAPQPALPPPIDPRLLQTPSGTGAPPAY